MNTAPRPAIRPRMTAEGAWLTATRIRFGLCQSDVATFLRIKIGKPFNQGRVTEMEQGKRPIPPDLMKVLTAFFKKVEQLHKQNRSWTETIR